MAHITLTLLTFMHRVLSHSRTWHERLQVDVECSRRRRRAPFSVYLKGSLLIQLNSTGLLQRQQCLSMFV